jgi:putative heme-binding domain-containing protein
MDLARLLAAFEKSASDAVGEKLAIALNDSPAAPALDKRVVDRILSRYSPSIREQASMLLERIDAADAVKAARFDEILKLVHQGDVRRGQEVFFSTKAACSSCHAVGYRGGKIGPDLTSVGRIRDERSLLESILYPSSSFVQSYEPLTIVTTSGKIHSGVIREESPKEIILNLDAEKTIRIPRDEIDETRPGSVSIMPTGLEKQLTPQQLADLLVFLKNVK